MKVLAFDPGYDRLGVAVLERDGSKEKLIHSACILTNKKEGLEDRLKCIGDEIERLLAEHAPDAVALENLFFNQNVNTAIGVAQVRGIIIYLAKKTGCALYEFGPQEVKVAVTGYGKSDKQAVMQMVQRLILNAPVKGHDDEYDAIAIGITALAHHRN